MTDPVLISIVAIVPGTLAAIGTGAVAIIALRVKQTIPTKADVKEAVAANTIEVNESIHGLKVTVDGTIKSMMDEIRASAERQVAIIKEAAVQAAILAVTAKEEAALKSAIDVESAEQRTPTATRAEKDDAAVLAAQATAAETARIADETARAANAAEEANELMKSGPELTKNGG